MKKLHAILLGLVLVLGMTACGGTQGEGKSGGPIALTAGETQTVDGYAEFKLFKITTTDTITASVDNSYYYGAPAGSIYVDMVLDYTNLTDRDIACDELVEVSAVNSAGASYNCESFFVESSGGMDIDNYAVVAPQSSARLHCATAVNPDETSLTFTLKVNNQKYTCDYTLNETVRDVEAIKKGDVIEAEDFAQIKFNGAKYKNELLPSNTSGYYSYYSVKDVDNTYLIISMDITNYQGSSRNIDSFVGARVTYLDKYTYTGFVVAEESDHTGFDAYASISPLTEKTVYFVIEVPKKVTENQAVVELSFRNKEYIYTYSK